MIEYFFKKNSKTKNLRNPEDDLKLLFSEFLSF